MDYTRKASIQRKTLWQQIADVLREDIIQGKIKPGERIVEEDIAEKFHVSRGPVREALRHIGEEGFVVYESHKGSTVKTISYEEMMQMACLGAGVLETRSVELASKYNVPLFLGKALETDLEKGTWIMHKELEDMPITGLSVKDDYAIMRFMHLPNDGVYLGKLFKMISDLNINLDTISQQLDDEGLANFTLYCSEEQSNQIMENASKEYPVHQMLGYIKLSLEGLGISTLSGIASKVLTILSENNIKYYMITSSEISISLTIEKKDKVKAVQALGKAFDL